MVLFTERHSRQLLFQTLLLSSARRLRQSLGDLEEFAYTLSFLEAGFDGDFFRLSHDFSFAHRTHVCVIINTYPSGSVMRNSPRAL